MAHEPIFNKIVEEFAGELHEVRQRAKKVKTAPLGMERVTPRTLRERWPTIGKEARQKIMSDLASAEDPEGVRAVMKLLRGDDA